MIPKRSRTFTLKEDSPEHCAQSNHSLTSKTDSCNSSRDESESQRRLPVCCRASDKKKVRFAKDDDGNKFCTVFQVRSYREYEYLWWSDEQLRSIKSGCSDIASKYREKKQFCAAIIDLMMNALQCQETQDDLDMFMEAMNDHSEARGLEPYIVAPCKKLGKIHYDAVLDAQQEAYDNGFYGSDKAKADISQASVQTSRPFVILAIRQAQFDAREAMRAAFSRWNFDGNHTVKSRTPLSRRSSMSRIQSCRSTSITSFYSSAMAPGKSIQSDWKASGHASGSLSQSEHKPERKTLSKSKPTSSIYPLRRSSIF